VLPRLSNEFVKVLITIESFLPGLGGGGPVRAAANLLQHLGHSIEFGVLTRNHDYLENGPYRNVPVDRWIDCPGGQVRYATDANWFRAFEETVAAWQPDWVYLNGLFAPMTRQILASDYPRRSLVLAPHGNLGPGAMRKGRWKKNSWILLARARRLPRGLRWHAGSSREAEQIRAHFGRDADIRIVPMAPGAAPEKLPSLERNPSTLRLVYFGRLSSEKNLPFAFGLLRRFATERPKLAVRFDLFGPGTDSPPLIGELPENLHISIHPAVDRETLMETLCSESYSAMLLPSLSENFSYTILEAMQAGISPLVSDQTPWRGLAAAGVGWDLALGATESWLEALRALADETAEAWHARRARVRDFISRWTAGYSAAAKELFSPPAA